MVNKLHQPLRLRGLHQTHWAVDLPGGFEPWFVREGLPALKDGQCGWCHSQS